MAHLGFHRTIPLKGYDGVMQSKIDNDSLIVSILKNASVRSSIMSKIFQLLDIVIVRLFQIFVDLYSYSLKCNGMEHKR
jgi:hypothetical protein